MGPHTEGSNSVSIFQEYMLHLLPYNPQWKMSSPLAANLRLSNEIAVDNAKKGFSEAVCENGQGALVPPIEVAVNEVYGRHFVASRNIAPGEIVLVEPPLVLALRAKSPPYCSTCYRRAGDYTCPKCGFFLCDDSCLTEEHNEECSILQRFELTGPTKEEQSEENRLIQERLGAMSPDERVRAESLLLQAKTSATQQRHYEVLRQYTVVPTIKTLLAMNKNDLTRRVILSLQGNLDETSQRYRINQKRIVDVVLDRLKASTDSPLVHKICSVWDTNGFEVPLGFGTRVHGLYPFASLLTHECRANTQQWFTTAGILVLRSVEHIPAGTVVTTCYTDPQWATMLRQDHLRVSKQFLCTCQRCADPTEMGTFMGSLRCPGCGGPMVSSAPLEPKAIWICHAGCPHTASAKQVTSVGASVGAKIRGLNPTDTNAISTIADQLKELLHPTHHVLLQLHVSTLKTIADKDLRDLPDDVLDTLRAIASLVVDVAKKVEAPLTRLSVRMVREDLRIRLETLRRRKLQGCSVGKELQDLASTMANCEMGLGWDARMPSFEPVMQEYLDLVNIP